ncbi:ribosomal RNA small subunit methyltransferase H [Marivirga tractuosa]|uniref:Ribosomal RNA small subunit methyltransferase H n=1 Tax=Marivirga tractuosa (strain ATCC 23168 / DSM 4126 / NBRC 15989 / NCIMB 1408 / VKM B-1430 / H-43) TaxID=643867 RepID=E4TW42_MARTH|nr:16S rRNA (cytosine(1402)-N(4))-methyltransferase RsmH [Marivirga tractuosa]ADR23260.1 S-adenosyl-methyltransferase MraW [Marivirga tractuosa DSM 4126]BDD16066.1 ribosomal RNA small subunit methyltransferase H [Marivirga tractuosa]
MSEYHEPVMLQQCLDGLAIKPNGIYVDLTFGGGGHSKAILEKLTDGKLLGFDQDQDAEVNAEAINHPGFEFVQANFRFVKKYLKLYRIKQVDGVLADLGVSSHQFNKAERGFSTRFDAELDMRMDQHAPVTAKEVINEYSESDLHKIFGLYGEVRNAKTLASAIVSARAASPINTIGELKEILARFAKRGRENKYYAQVFQALRIEVNEELKALEEALLQMEEVIKPGGRLVVMSYHSLEDRLVKNYINKGKLDGEEEKDFYGNVLKPFKSVNRKPITAEEEELENNNRARSAKLRIAEKL